MSSPPSQAVKVKSKSASDLIELVTVDIKPNDDSYLEPVPASSELILSREDLTASNLNDLLVEAKSVSVASRVYFHNDEEDDDDDDDDAYFHRVYDLLTGLFIKQKEYMYMLQVVNEHYCTLAALGECTATARLAERLGAIELFHKRSFLPALEHAIKRLTVRELPDFAALFVAPHILEQVELLYKKLVDELAEGLTTLDGLVAADSSLGALVRSVDADVVKRHKIFWHEVGSEYSIRPRMRSLFAAALIWPQIVNKHFNSMDGYVLVADSDNNTNNKSNKKTIMDSASSSAFTSMSHSLIKIV